jgi:signal transduction histidine kinase
MPVESHMTSFFSRRDGTPETQTPGTVRVGHVYLDAAKRRLYCLNETARQLIREGVPVSREDLERQPLHTTAGAPVTAADLPLLRAWREHTAQEATFVFEHPEGPVLLLRWSAAPVWDAGGQLQGVVGSLVVTSPEPDWQEMAGLAHDLRTPLQAVRLLVPLLDSTPLLHPEARELLDRLRSSAERALAVGLDLLEWCRGPVTGGRAVERKWFPLVPVLSALAGEQLTAAQRKGLTLTTDLAAAEGQAVNTDAVRLGRLLANLLSNAVRYTTAGEVRFSAQWREEPPGQRQALVLGVIDTGIGISAEDQESIFQPFERGKAGKEKDEGGSGVGLAVVDRLVKELGLTLEVFSQYGYGSRFELLLPTSILREQEKTPQPSVPTP